jgi:21S rRNA (uridine2791-2'-O)-methyltransferase
MAALSFASDTLRPGGHFVCKFYQGSEDKALENKLKKLFAKVHREKPDSSRTVGSLCRKVRIQNADPIAQESKEAYFVALKRRGNVRLEDLE